MTLRRLDPARPWTRSMIPRYGWLWQWWPPSSPVAGVGGRGDDHLHPQPPITALDIRSGGSWPPAPPAKIRRTLPNADGVRRRRGDRAARGHGRVADSADRYP